MNNFNSEMWVSVTTIFAAIIGVASLAVFFGKNSQTANVISASFNGLSGALQSAEAPVLGNSSGGSANANGMSLLQPLQPLNYAAPLTDGYAY